MVAQIHISKRLELVASFIPENSFFADIGSDHAYLPCFVCLHHPQVQAIAGEVNAGPFERARETVLRYNLVDRVDVRLGNGLEVIHKKDKIDTVVIAGMGGALITSILSAGVDTLQHIPKIIAQPNNHAQNIRRFFSEQQYEITDECILEENGHIYEIIVGEKNPSLQEKRQSKEELEKLWLFGPKLMVEKSETFLKKWQAEYKKVYHIIEQMQQASSRDEQKISALQLQLQWIEEVLA